jgi:hypothetical protein
MMMMMMMMMLMMMTYGVIPPRHRVLGSTFSTWYALPPAADDEQSSPRLTRPSCGLATVKHSPEYAKVGFGGMETCHPSYRV